MSGIRHSLFRRPSIALASVAALTFTVAACGDDDAADDITGGNVRRFGTVWCARDDRGGRTDRR